MNIFAALHARSKEISKERDESVRRLMLPSNKPMSKQKLLRNLYHQPAKTGHELHPELVDKGAGKNCEKAEF